MFRNSRLSILFIISLLTMVLVGCSNEEAVSKDKLQVAVSVVPEATFVEKVAGDLVDVVTLVPPGASPANYAPTPKEMIDLEDSAIYFAIGVATEVANIMPNMIDGSDVKVVELNQVVGQVYPDRFFGSEENHLHEEGEDHDHDEDMDDADHDDHDEDADHDEEGDHDDHDHEAGSRDPHIWLSPKRVVVMVETIRDELSLLDPDNEDIYRDNAEAYIQELYAVDKELAELFSAQGHLDFIITHPSIGYFADEYGLHMTSLEQDGKTATAAWMQEIIDFAQVEDIHVIFYQAEFDSSQSEALAEAIDGKAVEIAPLSPDYIQNLKAMAEAFIDN